MDKRQIQLISSLMKEKSISIPTMASECGISHMTIRRILQDETYNPTSDTIRKIADALDITVSQLMQDDVSGETDSNVNGFIEYNGEIFKIKSFAVLQKLVYRISYETKELPKEADTIIKQNKVNKETQSKQPLDINSIDLYQAEQYDTSKVATWDFRKSDDEREEQPNNLGNMCKGYEFDISSIHFLNSEAAYICGLFSNDTKEHQDIQKELIAESNGYATKKVIRRKYEQIGRKDWNDYNVQWMLYVVWCKVRQNKAFSDLLKRIPNNCIIVENSTHQKAQKGANDTSKFWGAKNKELEDKRDVVEYNAEIQNIDRRKKDIDVLKMKARNCISNFGTWEGVNCMGKILTICKYCIEHKTEPPIDYELLRSKKIHILGELLTFDNEAKATKYKTLIFDFDGTLLDTSTLTQYEHLFKDHKRNTEDWKQGRKEYLSHVKDCTLFKGMDAVIEFIRQNKINVAVVTANTKDRVVEAIKAKEWTDIIPIKNIIGCYALGMNRISKEDGNSTLFQKALEELKLSASECISFGNEIDDYKAASNIGIKAYNCMWGASKIEKDIMFKEMKDKSLKRPKDIIEAIKNQ